MPLQSLSKKYQSNIAQCKSSLLMSQIVQDLRCISLSQLRLSSLHVDTFLLAKTISDSIKTDSVEFIAEDFEQFPMKFALHNSNYDFIPKNQWIIIKKASFDYGTDWLKTVSSSDPKMCELVDNKIWEEAEESINQQTFRYVYCFIDRVMQESGEIMLLCFCNPDFKKGQQIFFEFETDK